MTIHQDSYLRPRWQYQPEPHDPNPPISLENQTGLSIIGTVGVTQAISNCSVTAKEIFSGTVAGNQIISNELIQGKEIFTGSVAENQSIQTISVSGKEIFTGTVAVQASQTVGIDGKENFLGSVSEQQVAQTVSIIGKEIFSGTGLLNQVVQVILGSGKEIYIGNAAVTQSIPLGVVASLLVFTGQVLENQNIQECGAACFETFTGSASCIQFLQSIVAQGSIGSIITGSCVLIQVSQISSVASLEKFLGNSALEQEKQQIEVFGKLLFNSVVSERQEIQIEVIKCKRNVIGTDYTASAEFLFDKGTHVINGLDEHRDLFKGNYN